MKLLAKMKQEDCYDEPTRWSEWSRLIAFFWQTPGRVKDLFLRMTSRKVDRDISELLLVHHPPSQFSIACIFAVALKHKKIKTRLKTHFVRRAGDCNWQQIAHECVKKKRHRRTWFRRKTWNGLSHNLSHHSRATKRVILPFQFDTDNKFRSTMVARKLPLLLFL